MKKENNIKKLKPTNRIIKAVGAIGTVSMLTMSSGFAAFNTYNFPDSFTQDGEFVGDIVIGENAPQDRTIAQDMIDSLQEREGQTRIVYRESANQTGEAIDAASREDLNYGETLGDVSERGGFDDGDIGLLRDERFTNRISNEDYGQTLELQNGEFNYALRDEVDDVDEITDGIFYGSNDVFAIYTLDMDNAIDLADTTDLNNDMVGSELTIMGNEFTISSITADGSDLETLELIGGPQRVALDEGESTTVTVDGEEVEIEVRIVSSDRVSLIVNGQSRTLDLFETEDVNGVTLAVTELVESSRETISGFAEIAIGGQKITLRDDNARVQINDEDVDDVFEQYDVTSDFSNGNNGLDEITITYRVDDDVLLQEGDELEDVLFNTFSIRYNGINDVTYENIELSSTDDTADISGLLITGDEITRDLLFTNTTDGTDGVTYLIADEDEDKRLFFQGSDPDIFLPTGITSTGNDSIELDFSESELEGNGFLMSIDNDEQFWYEITRVDTTDLTVDLEELFENTRIREVTPSEFVDDIEVELANAISDDTNGTLELDLTEFGTPVIGFENELMMNVANAESAAGIDGNISFFYDGDISADRPEDEDENFSVTLSWDTNDDEIDLNLDTSDTDFVNVGDADSVSTSSDLQVFVTSYGTQVEYDNDENRFVRVMAPDEQVRADVELAFGAFGSGEQITEFVDPDEVDERVEELEDDGFEIISIDEDVTDGVDYSGIEIMTADEVNDMENKIVIGGPAVNEAAADILNLPYPTYGPQTELDEDEAVVRYYDTQDALLIYGWEAKDTRAATEELLDTQISQRETFMSNIN